MRCWSGSGDGKNPERRKYECLIPCVRCSGVAAIRRVAGVRNFVIVSWSDPHHCRAEYPSCRHARFLSSPLALPHLYRTTDMESCLNERTHSLENWSRKGCANGSECSCVSNKNAISIDCMWTSRHERNTTTFDWFTLLESRRESVKE